MGLQDRDYMRRSKKVLPFARKTNWRRHLILATAIIGVLSAGILLIRNTADLAGDFRPEPGSLIVNINTATEAELQTVPRVGPARAAQIVAGRPYDSVEDLSKIVGIGDESLEGLRPFVTTDGETRARQVNAP